MAAVSAAAQTNNILLLIADDLGADSFDLCNSTNTGAHLPPTPNLDKLAQRGVLFTHFYARPSCSQSRACIFTGRNSFRTGVGVAISGNTNMTPVLRPTEYTLAKAFTTNAPNFALASFGKWHLGAQTDINSPLTTGGWTNFAGYYGPMVQDYFNWTKWVNGTSSVVTDYSTSVQVNDALAFIQSQGTNLWFVWLAFNAPHAPLHKPPVDLAPDYAYLPGTQPDIAANPRPYYEAMVQALDSEIGRLLASVPTNKTDIIFLGDNGTPVNVQQPPYKVPSVPATTNGTGHGKFTMYEGGTRTPLFITGPDVVNGGRTNESLVNEVDIFQTIQELAGINVAATLPAGVIIDSHSLMPALKADVLLTNDNYLLEEQFNEHTSSDGIALRNSQFKIIHFYSHTEEMYDLSNDPYEYTNLLSGALTANAQANYNALKLHSAPYQTLANTVNTRNLLPYPMVLGLAYSNSTFVVNEQYTRLSTNGFFPNANQPGLTELALGGSNLNYNLILWRAPNLLTATGWSPVATNLVTGVTNSYLLLTNSLIMDAGATASSYFYQVTPYIP